MAELVTESIQETWSEVLAEPDLVEDLSELERLWNLAQLHLVPYGLCGVALERCLLLEEVLAGLRCPPMLV